MNTQNQKPSPPSRPKLSPAEEQLFSLMSQALQMERLVWLMANQQGGEMVVDEAALSPLWTTQYTRVPEAAKTLLRITATQLQEPTDTQIKKLADLLADQPEEATPHALLQVGLSNYPPAYICSRLAPLVRCQNGMWNRT